MRVCGHAAVRGAASPSRSSNVSAGRQSVTPSCVKLLADLSPPPAAGEGGTEGEPERSCFPENYSDRAVQQLLQFIFTTDRRSFETFRRVRLNMLTSNHQSCQTRTRLHWRHPLSPRAERGSCEKLLLASNFVRINKPRERTRRLLLNAFDE